MWWCVCRWTHVKGVLSLDCDWKKENLFQKRNDSDFKVRVFKCNVNCKTISTAVVECKNNWHLHLVSTIPHFNASKITLCCIIRPKQKTFFVLHFSLHWVISSKHEQSLWLTFSGLSLRWKFGEDTCFFRGLWAFLAFLAAENTKTKQKKKKKHENETRWRRLTPSAVTWGQLFYYFPSLKRAAR